MADYFQRSWQIVDILNNRFPDGNDPFRIITRLCEEAGELAAEVNHFEGVGVKRQKHGEPDRENLSKEVVDVLFSSLAIARYYGIEEEVYARLDMMYQRGKEQGYLPEERE